MAKPKCKCGHPCYWCSGCNTYHHEPWGDVEDCVDAGGPFVVEIPTDNEGHGIFVLGDGVVDG